MYQMIAIKLCSHEYSDWCDTVQDNVYLAASLEAVGPLGGAFACFLVFLVSCLFIKVLFLKYDIIGQPIKKT